MYINEKTKSKKIVNFLLKYSSGSAYTYTPLVLLSDTLSKPQYALFQVILKAHLILIEIDEVVLEIFRKSEKQKKSQCIETKQKRTHVDRGIIYFIFRIGSSPKKRRHRLFETPCITNTPDIHKSPGMVLPGYPSYHGRGINQRVCSNLPL